MLPVNSDHPIHFFLSHPFFILDRLSPKVTWQDWDPQLLNAQDSAALSLYRLRRQLTHGCKSVPQVFLVNNAIPVLVNYCEGLWRAEARRDYVSCGRVSASLLQADQILRFWSPARGPLTLQAGRGVRNLSPSPSPKQVHIPGRGGQQGVPLVSLQSPFSPHLPP